MRDPRVALLTIGGLGYLPASGTFGSMPTVAVAGALLLAGYRPDTYPFVYHGALLAVLLFCGGGCLAYGPLAEIRWKKKDPGQVVADEAAAQVLPLLFIPASMLTSQGRGALALLMAFLAFRLFDIVKPPPARRMERAPAGWGILLDDLIAGAYAMAAVQVLWRFVL